MQKPSLHDLTLSGELIVAIPEQFAGIEALLIRFTFQW